MENLMFQAGIFALLFLIGWIFGRYNERKHWAELELNEARLAYISTDNQRFATSCHHGQLISSNVVISHDYFKFVIATIQNFFGGPLKTYESILERARREAVVRLKLEAEKIGATHIMGLRLSTTEMGMQGKMVEVFAYGTAILTPSTAP